MTMEIEDKVSFQGSNGNKEALKNSEGSGTKLQEGVMKMDKDEKLKEVCLIKILVTQPVLNKNSNNDVIQKALTVVVKLVKGWK